MSKREQEELSRGWIRKSWDVLGPKMDVPAPDIMTRPEHMGWMLDEYETISRTRVPEFITGKDIAMGGSQGRTEATGFGVVFCAEQALLQKQQEISQSTASIQGAGNVGQFICQKFTELGGRITGISCWDAHLKQAFTYVHESGILPDDLQRITNEYGTIDAEQANKLGWQQQPGDDWLKQPVDILFPAALENALNQANVEQIHEKATLIVEGANGPTTPEADEILQQRNITVVPDFLANAGGVLVSYFEQVQNTMNYHWQQAEIHQKLEEKMVHSFEEVHQDAQKKDITLRDSAYHLAIQRVAQAVKARGWV